MKKWLHKFLLCVVACMIILPITACQDPENSSPLEIENEYYRLDKENGKWYLEFKDEAKIPDVDEIDGYNDNFRKFNSVADFYEKLLYTGLPERAMAYAKEGFDRNDDRRLLLVDIENLYIPVLPCGCQSYDSCNVLWGGVSLAAEISCQHADYEIDLPPERIGNSWKLLLDRQFDLYFEEYFDDRTIHSEEKIPERNATVYYSRPARTSYQGESIWNVMYTLTNQEKTVHVHEEYSNAAWQKEDRVPDRIFLFIEENDVRYFCIVKSLTGSRPTEEWLLSIGVTPFVPEEKSPAA